MKSWFVAIWLVVGFWNAGQAQVFRNKEKREGAEHYTKVKPHRQVAHFEKQDKDKKLAHNGSNYKRPRNFKVDGNGFAAYQPLRNDNGIGILPDKSKKYQRKYKRMMYAVK